LNDVISVAKVFQKVEKNEIMPLYLPSSLEGLVFKVEDSRGDNYFQKPRLLRRGAGFTFRIFLTMKKLILLPFLFLMLSTHSFADDDMQHKTAACRMEVKILGHDSLEEDQNCLWLVEHTGLVVEKCHECLPDLELIKEASQGYFDY